MGDWDDDDQSEEKTNFSKIQEDTNLRNYLQKCRHHMTGTPPPPTLPCIKCWRDFRTHRGTRKFPSVLCMTRKDLSFRRRKPNWRSIILSLLKTTCWNCMSMKLLHKSHCTVSLLSLVVALLAKLPKSCLPFKLAMVLINFIFFHLKIFLIKKFSLLLHAECVLCIFLPVSSHPPPCT